MEKHWITPLKDRSSAGNGQMDRTKHRLNICRGKWHVHEIRRQQHWVFSNLCVEIVAQYTQMTISASDLTQDRHTVFLRSGQVRSGQRRQKHWVPTEVFKTRLPPAAAAAASNLTEKPYSASQPSFPGERNYTAKLT